MNGCRTQEGREYDIYLDKTPEGGKAHHGSCIELYSKTYKGGGDVGGIGLGFVQWTSHNRRLGYLKMMEEYSP
jgi:hypothetical protein